MDNHVNLTPEQMQQLAKMIAAESVKNSYLLDRLNDINSGIARREKRLKELQHRKAVFHTTMQMSDAIPAGAVRRTGEDLTDWMLRQAEYGFFPVLEAIHKTESEIAELKKRKKTILGKLFPASPAE